MMNHLSLPSVDDQSYGHLCFDILWLNVRILLVNHASALLIRMGNQEQHKVLVCWHVLMRYYYYYYVGT